MRTRELIRFVSRWSIEDTFSKNIRVDDPQNGGHFSCRKPVSHVGTSTVSDSEALIHLAYVQHKICCYFGRLDQVED